MKYLIYCCCMLLFSCGTQAQGTEYEASGEEEEIEGVLEKRPWRKSTESYCAQGSDYYVLTNTSGSYILKDLSEVAEDIASLEGKKLLLTVVEVQKTIKAERGSQQPISQRPQTSFPVEQRPSSSSPIEGEEEVVESTENAYQCTVWEVKGLKVL